MIYTIIVVIIAIICLLLTFAVLLQSGDGNGLSGIASTGSSTQMMGSRRTSDLLSKATTYLGSAFLVLCILANFAIDHQAPTQSTIQQQAPINTNFQNDFNLPSETESALPTNNEGGGDSNPDSE